MGLLWSVGQRLPTQARKEEKENGLATPKIVFLPLTPPFFNALKLPFMNLSPLYLLPYNQKALIYLEVLGVLLSHH